MTTHHARWVRISHGIVTVSVLTLAVTGVLILMVHPRLYWGEVGNDLTPALLELPISRNHQHGGWENRTPFFMDDAGPVSASRTFDIFNQNGWGRSLHFLADITSFPATGTTNPGVTRFPLADTWRREQTGSFADYRLQR